MSSLDEIKKKLNLDQMDDSSRKEMFDKFVEKGGQVIKEKPKPKNISFNRDRQKLFHQQFEKKQDELNKKYANKKRKSNGNGDSVQYQKKYSFVDFIIGIIKGIFTIRKNFNKKFRSHILEDFTQVLSGINFLTTQIITLEDNKKWQLIDIVNKNFSLSYEIILRFYDLYKVNSISSIQRYFENTNHIECDEILKPLMKIYRELVILYPYWESNKEILAKSVAIYEKLTNNQTNFSKSKIYKYVDRLFAYYLPNFHYILCYNFNEKVPFEFASMRSFAKILDEEDIGSISKSLLEERKIYLKKIQKEKEERKKKLQESVEQKEMDKIPTYIQKGLRVIDGIIDKSSNFIKTDKYAKQFNENEKMLYFYILFHEFDKEYSFLMTSSQLAFTSRLESGTKIDVRKEMDECFIKFNEVNNFLHDYFEQLEIEQELKLELESSDTRRNVHSKLAELDDKKTKIFKETKIKASIFFKKFAITLQKIITDYNGEKLLIQNPDDNLQFPLSREKKRFENVPIIKAISAAFSFTSALHYYVNYDKLAQKNIYFEQDKEKNENNTENNESEQEIK